MGFLGDLARAGFVLPAEGISEFSSVDAQRPLGVDTPGRAAGIACAPGTVLDGLGVDRLGGGPANAPGRAQDACAAERAARPDLCSQCQDEPVWHPESDIGFCCVEQRLRAWGGGA